MDYPSQAAAAEAGAINLRQNIRLLDKVVQLGVEGWLRLIEAGRVRPDEVDWLLCHYSSHFFRSQIIELLEKAGLHDSRREVVYQSLHAWEYGLCVDLLDAGGTVSLGQVTAGAKDFLLRAGEWAIHHGLHDADGGGRQDAPDPCSKSGQPQSRSPESPCSKGQ
jgi:hypothetical protein